MATKFFCDKCGTELSHPGGVWMRICTDVVEFNEDSTSSMSPWKYQVADGEEFVLCPECYKKMTEYIEGKES